MILHRIARDPRVKGEWALNSVLVAFERFLHEKKDFGVVVIDRLPEKARAYDMLKRKFQVGLEIQPTGTTVKLSRVVLYATTCDGASHLSSAVDIVLGGLRWVVNQRKSPNQAGVAGTLLNNVAKMMYHKKDGDGINFREYGLILRPLEIKHPPYEQEYDDLVEYLGSFWRE